MDKHNIAQFTERGFELHSFTDSNGIECSLQKSSSIEDRIWVGANEIGLKKLDINGWVELDTKDCIANTRMHLTQKQVKELLPYLKRFVKTGNIFKKKKKKLSN